MTNQENNREKRLAKKRAYYQANKEKYHAYTKKWRANPDNKEKKLQQDREYNKLNKRKRVNKQYFKEYRLLNKDRINAYEKKKRLTDPLYKLRTSIRVNIGKGFKRNGYTKKSKTFEILGCSYEDLKYYLESKFESWMTWENKGLYNGELNYGWDIDHIIPVTSATTEAELIALNHYTNLQPLCSYINRNVKRDIL
jgi:hypothetical protein